MSQLIKFKWSCRKCGIHEVVFKDKDTIKDFIDIIENEHKILQHKNEISMYHPQACFVNLNNIQIKYVSHL